MKYHIKQILRILFVVSAVSILQPVTPLKAQEEVQQNQLKFGRLLRLIDGYYVDTANINKLTEKAIIHLLGDLDPHSVYISKEEVEKMNEPLRGNFEGIGIQFNIFRDTLLVTATIPGGPSEKVGLQAGDRIIEVESKNIAGTGLTSSDVFDMLRGKKGTSVEIKVLRRGMNEVLDFTIVRDKIPINSLDASYMIDEVTGYIKLNKFSATTTEEFTGAMEELKKENLQNLILDLRGNGGGYLKTAIEISDQFLKNDKLVVYTNGTNEPKKEYRATIQGDFKEGNLVVLVDESSASASEIVSGAVQDWDRGLIVGRRTYGKGLVQKPYFLTDGSVVRLTTAHYYTPSGRCIQRPYDNGTEEYRRDYMERLETGELFSEDSILLADSLKYRTLINERIVYGGGGIMPDIFVAMDTSGYFQYYNRLRRNNVIYDFVLDYVDDNRSKLKKKYPEFEKFNKEFEVTDDMIAAIIEEGTKKNIEKDEESLSFNQNRMKREIKALIVRNIYSRNDFYKVLYEEDETLKKALEVIEDQEKYNQYLVTIE